MSHQERLKVLKDMCIYTYIYIYIYIYILYTHYDTMYTYIDR